jgi:hypothetical protein
MNDNNLTKVDYFDLRTKRLTLVYKILYVFVAAWIAMFVTAVNGLQNGDFDSSHLPSISFFISSLSLCVIQMLSYILSEFRCMKVYNSYDEKLWQETEKKYDNIWNSFGIILMLNLLSMLLSTGFFNSITIMNEIVVILLILSFVYTIKNVIYLFAWNKWPKFWKGVSIASILISPIYSYCLTFWLMGGLIK